jgi:hypothetical protein
MTTIIEFLNARIAEDERRFDLPDFREEDSARGPGWGNRGECPICGGYMFSGTESVTEDGWWDHAEEVHWRTRWLAECAAKRAILAAQKNQEGGDDDMAWIVASEVLLKALAAVYKEHPDYWEEWTTL